MPDKAEMILRLGGSAMSLDELTEAIDEDRNPRTLANKLGAEDRFMRRGKSRWAMRWRPALNAFAITLEGRIVASTTN